MTSRHSQNGPKRRRPAAHRPPASQRALAGNRPKRSRAPLELHLRAGETVPRWADAAGWTVIGLAALALLWIAFGLHIVGDYYTESDFYGAYAAGARLIQSGRPDPSRYAVVGPGFDAAVALVGLVVRDLFTAAKVIATASAVATLVLWRSILRRRAGAGAALWGAALLAANALFVRYGYSSSTDMLATALQAAALYCLVAGAGPFAPLRSGAFAALATLTRYNAVYLVPAAIISYAWLGTAQGTSRRRAIGLHLAGFVAIAGPWLAFSFASGHVPGAELFQRFGSFYAVTDFSRNVQDMHAAVVDSIARARAHQAAASPAALALLLLRNIPEHLARDARELLGWPTAIACLVGLVLMVRQGTWRLLLPVWVSGALLFTTLVPVFYSDRYSLPLAPVYISAAAVALGGPLFARPLPWIGIPPSWLAAVIPLALTLRANAAYQVKVMLNWPHEVVEVGHALARIAPHDARVLSRKGQIGYYSGLEVVSFPRLDSLPELGEYCRRQRVGYLYYSWYEGWMRSEFGYLLDTTAVVPGLTRLYSTVYSPSVLYRVEPGFGAVPAWLNDPNQKALHMARGLVMVLPDSLAAGYHLILAYDAVHRDDPAGVLTHADGAIRGHPGDPRAWVLRGDALRILDRRQEALESYRTAFRLDPSQLAVAYAIGLTQLDMGDSLAAARTWRDVAPKVTEPRDLVQMLVVFERAGDHEAAEAVRARLQGARAP